MSAPMKRGTAQDACTEAKLCNATEWYDCSIQFIKFRRKQQQIMLVQMCTTEKIFTAPLRFV